MVWNDAYRAVAGEKHPTKVSSNPNLIKLSSR